jgi:Holliday junction resolvase-like predicted endonuclease
MHEERHHGQINNIDPKLGLHRIKDSIQLKYMGRQCEQLLKCLDEAIAVTECFAPSGKKTYKLDGKTRPGLNKPIEIREKHWEEALWRFEENLRKENAAWNENSAWAWKKIISLQELLKTKQTRDGWGEIDLLAISEVGLPVVIELKIKKNEYLLRALLEAAAYGIALKKVWPLINKQWEDAAKRLGIEVTPSLHLLSCPLAIIAPSDYWENCIGSAAQKRKSGQILPDAWRPFHQLVSALAQRGLPATFLEIESAGIDDNGLPAVTCLKRVPLPPER